MAEGTTDRDQQVTLGGPVLTPRPGSIPGPDPTPPPGPGTLYVGPPDDPDRFELLDDGTRGGEGRTWRAAYRGGLNNPLVQAVKMLFPPAGAGTGWPADTDMRRWQDQAALLRHLSQPHVVQLHDIFGGEPPHHRDAAGRTRSRVAYLVMEWVEGPTLADRLRSSPVTSATLTERLGYVQDIATAVAGLHSHTRSAGNPVLHRDLTPANCIVHQTRGIVVVDISGMRLIDDGFDPLGRHTPAYTAPEVLRAPHAPRAPSSDLYAVGAVALYCLTGEDPPTDRAGREALPDRVVALLRAAGTAEPQAAVEHLLQMLHDDPAERPTDVLAWCRTLSRLAGTRTRSRRPLGVAAAGALVVAMAASGVLFVQHHDGAGTARPATTRPATTPSVAAAPGLPRAAASGFSTSDFASTQGRITAPTSGQAVRDCEYFTGTAKLRAGQTLVLAMHDWSNDDNVRYVEVVFGFKHPETLATWRGAQYFNEHAIGQRILVELIELPLTDALTLVDPSQDYLAASRFASRGQVLAAVTVTRVNRKNPAFPCEGPH